MPVPERDYKTIDDIKYEKALKKQLKQKGKLPPSTGGIVILGIIIFLVIVLVYIHTHNDIATVNEAYRQIDQHLKDIVKIITDLMHNNS